MKKPPKVARRYTMVQGAPFSESNAQRIGEELQKIADSHEVEDLRSLDKHLVLEVLKKDPAHPLWDAGGYERDVDDAATRHWLEHTALILRSIRYYKVDVGSGMPKAVPMFVYAPLPEQQGRAQRRSRVLTEDALSNDPAFMSAIGQHIRRVSDALRALETLTSCREPPQSIAKLRNDLRHCLDEYLLLVDQGQAAE